MSFDHSESCFHCRQGCTHPHDDGDDLFEVDVMVGSAIPAIRGSRMRHGGTFTDPETGLSLGSGQWVQVRCQVCRSEAMTPIEAISHLPGGALDDLGQPIGLCQTCVHDMANGRRPGQGRRRAGRHHR